MGAAKKIVQLNRKTKKTELTEVVKDTEHPATLVDLSALARDLTWPERLNDDDVEAALRKPAQDKRDVSTEAEHPSQGAPDATVLAAPADTRRDMSKIALFASLVAVILLLGLYVHLRQNIKTLTAQVHDLSQMKAAVSTLDTKMNTMESRVAELDSLPAKTRAALMSSILQEMTQKTSYMSSQLESPEQQDKLMKAKELIQQVQTELNTVK